MPDESLGNALKFLMLIYKEADYIEPPEYTFTINIDIPSDVLSQRISVIAEGVSMADAILMFTKNVEIRFIIEPGKLTIQHQKAKSD